MDIIPRAPSRVLVVEGDDDKHVAQHVAKRSGLDTSSFEVVVKGGVYEVVDAMTADIKAPGRMVAGFVVDANDDVSGRWASIKDKLGQISLDLPGEPNPAGTIVGKTPRVGIWLMPDNESRGELEDFIATMIPEGDPVWPLAQKYIKGIPGTYRKFTPKKARRAEVYAWLASRKNPGPMGAAIGRHDLTTDGTPCREFSLWLRELFACGI